MNYNNGNKAEFWLAVLMGIFAIGTACYFVASLIIYF